MDAGDIAMSKKKRKKRKPKAIETLPTQNISPGNEDAESDTKRVANEIKNNAA